MAQTTVTLLILALLIVLTAIWAVRYTLLHRRGKSSSAGIYSYFVFTMAVSAFLVYAANRFVSRNTEPLSEDQFTRSNIRLRPDLMFFSYARLAREHPENFNYHYNHIKFYQQYYSDSLFSNDDREVLLGHLLTQYTALSLDDNETLADAGNFGKGLLYYYMGNYETALSRLEPLEGKNYPYVYEYIGKASKAQGLYSKAEDYFYKEIKSGGDIKGAYTELSYYWHEKKQYQELVKLLAEMPDRKWMPIRIQKEAYLHTGKIFHYLTAVAVYTFSQPGPFEYIAAILILLVWLIYLLKVNLYHRGFLKVLIMFAGGATSAFIALLLYDLVQLLTGFHLNGAIINDLVYTVVVVGGIEELVKLLPFLLLLYFSRSLKEPIDYLVYASIGAIGFAFVENLLYFSQNTPSVVSMRALLTTVGHMFGTTMVAYGLVLARFRHRRHPFFYILLFYLLAAVVHGLYDFFLLSKQGFNIPLLSILIWMGSIYAFSTFVNNALNNSTYFEGKARFNPAGITAFLTSSLLAIFVFEYLRNCFTYGPEITNSLFVPVVPFIIVLMFFLSRKLGDIDIMQNEWQPVRLFSIRRSRNYNKAIGMQVSLQAKDGKSKLQGQAPLYGSIIKRLRIGRATNFYILKLDAPLQLEEQWHEYVFIRSKVNAMLLVNNASIEVFLLTSTHEGEELQEHPNSRAHYRFVETMILN